jgi:hypothetical protein
VVGLGATSDQTFETIYTNMFQFHNTC